MTYASFACDHRQFKKVELQIKIVVVGEKLPYHNDARSIATNLFETKILVNSADFDRHKDVRFMSMDMRDIFLQSMIACLEYMKVQYKYFLEGIQQNYKLEIYFTTDTSTLKYNVECISSSKQLFLATNNSTNYYSMETTF